MRFQPSELCSATSKTKRSRENTAIRLPFSTELSATKPTLSWQPSSELSESSNETRTDQSPYDDWIEQNLKIQTEDGQTLPLRFTSSQRRINAAWDEAKAENGILRLLVLKCRRIRASTVTQARVFERGLRSGLSGQSLTLGDDDRSTDVQYWMTRRFRDHLPNKPTQTVSRRGRELIYEDPNAPSYPHPISFRYAFQPAHEYAGTAATLHLLHLTELSKWKDAVTTMGALMPAARLADVIAESTGNGQVGKGQYFYDMCQMAMRGRSEWKFVFIPWYEHEEYLIDSSSPRFERLMDAPLSVEELALMDAYDITEPQIAWRRSVIDTDYSGDVDMFRQEFPSNEDEAFLRVEGRRVFDMEACRIRRLEAEKRSAVAHGGLRWLVPPRLDEEGFCVNQSALSVEWVENASGCTTLYENLPDDDDDYTARRYAIAADVAEGVEGGDDSHAVLLDRRRRRVVAVWHGQMDASLFGEEIAKMVVWTSRGDNQTIACPEVNSMGNSTLARLFAIVGAVHVWRAEEHAPGAPYGARRAGRYGFYTSGNAKSGSKESAVQCLVDVIRDHGWLDPDVQFWSEALGVVREPNGVAALNGRDRTAARCILAFMDRYGQAAAIHRLKLPGRAPTDAFQRGKEKMHRSRRKQKSATGLGLGSREAVLGS